MNNKDKYIALKINSQKEKMISDNKIDVKVLVKKYGNMPKKKIAEEYRKTEEYKKSFNKIKEENTPELIYPDFTDPKIKNEFDILEPYLEKISNVENMDFETFLLNHTTEIMNSLNLEKLIRNKEVNIINDGILEIKDYLKNDEIVFERRTGYNYNYITNVYLNEDTFEEYIDKKECFGWEAFDPFELGEILCGCSSILDFIFDRLEFYYPEIANKIKWVRSNLFWFEFDEFYECESDISWGIISFFNKDIFLYYLHENYRYHDIVNNEIEKERKKALLQENIIKSMPEKYVDLFPMARKMNRHFILHIGPTNSGKTHDAVKELKESQNGIYLAPLRLLAYEQFEKLNDEGYSCSLRTGEERVDVPNSFIQSSTVEVLDITKHYSAAVIDECQMISDKERGGAWTKAIAGICAKRVHLCLSSEAKKIIIELIEQCGDSYEIVDHERFVPLVIDDEKFSFPDKIQKGDALIVFSKRNVHAVAAEISKKTDFSCSIIYGNLPYDVRHEQARRFAEKETDVLVATDAIGMGLNLPIRRIIFLETSKFDGFTKRFLTGREIKQIAGRAGRYGVYKKGYVSCDNSKKQIEKCLNKKEDDIEYAAISFPETLLSIDSPLLDILIQWDKVTKESKFVKTNTDTLINLCKIIDNISDDKYFLYKCLTIAFDDKDPTLLYIWKRMCDAEAKNETFDVITNIPSIKYGTTMDMLEDYHKQCDLLYQYCDKFNHSEYIEMILTAKKEISKKLLQELDKGKLKEKACKYCHKPLPWNYPYGMCEKCHNEIYWNYDYMY